MKFTDYQHLTVTSETILLCYLLGLVPSGSGENLAINKTVYLDPGSTSSVPSSTVDGDPDSAGVFQYWLVVDLGANYLVEEAVIDYLSYGGSGSVEIQVYVSSPVLFPSPYQEAKSCYSQVCYAGSVRRLKTFTCTQPLLGRFVRVRRYSFDHPYFRVHEIQITGTAPEPCLYRTLKKAPDSIVQTSPTSFTTSSSSSLIHCVITCTTEPGCEAVNFNHVTGQCEIVRTTGNDIINSNDKWSVAYYV